MFVFSSDFGYTWTAVTDANYSTFAYHGETGYQVMSTEFCEHYTLNVTTDAGSSWTHGCASYFLESGQVFVVQGKTVVASVVSACHLLINSNFPSGTWNFIDLVPYGCGTNIVVQMAVSADTLLLFIPLDATHSDSRWRYLTGFGVFDLLNDAMIAHLPIFRTPWVVMMQDYGVLGTELYYASSSTEGYVVMYVTTNGGYNWTELPLSSTIMPTSNPVMDISGNVWFFAGPTIRQQTPIDLYMMKFNTTTIQVHSQVQAPHCSAQPRERAEATCIKLIAVLPDHHPGSLDRF